MTKLDKLNKAVSDYDKIDLCGYGSIDEVINTIEEIDKYNKLVERAYLIYFKLISTGAYKVLINIDDNDNTVLSPYCEKNDSDKILEILIASQKKRYDYLKEKLDKLNK